MKFVEGLFFKRFHHQDSDVQFTRLVTSLRIHRADNNPLSGKHKSQKVVICTFHLPVHTMACTITMYFFYNKTKQCVDK